MRKLLAIVGLFIGLSSVASAETLKADFGSFSAILPLQVVDVIQLYEFSAGEGFTGAQTTLIASEAFHLNFGGATGYSKGTAFPFVSIDTRLTEKFFDTSDNELRFGAWIGRDFGAKENKWGVAASIALW
jgi:hypothetical protein